MPQEQDHTATTRAGIVWYGTILTTRVQPLANDNLALLLFLFAARVKQTQQSFHE